MEEEFLRKYYSVGKTTSVQKAIFKFTQGTSETFHETWERLGDLTRGVHLKSPSNIRQMSWGKLPFCNPYFC